MPHPGDSPNRDVRLAWLREYLRSSLWFVPSLVVMLVAAVVLGFLAVDDRLEERLAFTFTGNASSARDVLSTIATSTLTMTSFVLSVTIVALQLASQQFSPRVMRTFFRDTGTKVAIGILLGTFVAALLVLRAVEPAETPDEEFVPGLAITGSFVLTLVSLVTFVYFINHVAQAIRVTNIIEAVAAETRDAIRAVAGLGTEAGESALPDREPDRVIDADLPPGVLRAVNVGGLVRAAAGAGCVVRVRHHVGDYLPSGVPLLDVWGVEGDAGDVDPDDLLVHVGLGTDRTMEQDVGFGFRQLVDVAERALSPGINDPTTAVQAIDRMHDLLRRLAATDLPTGVHCDDDGAVRLLLAVRTWEDYLAAAVVEISRYGGASVQVHRRLQAMLADLRDVVATDPVRRSHVDEHLARLDRIAEREFPDLGERAVAGVADAQGFGGAAT